MLIAALCDVVGLETSSFLLFPGVNFEFRFFVVTWFGVDGESVVVLTVVCLCNGSGLVGRVETVVSICSSIRLVTDL